MNIWHISDTHGYHRLLIIPENIDIIIHSGDYSNFRDPYRNEQESLNFLHWYGNLKIPTKILISGNHDAYSAALPKEFRKWCNHYNIIYLENEEVTIDGIKIWGSPYTPKFGNWHFMRDRSKLNKIWETIPDDVDIIITHGPPKGILDSSSNYNNYIEICGCSALMKRIMKIKPKYVLFGHLHNNDDIINAGTRTIPNLDTIFINGSVVTDRKFGTLSSNGTVFKI